MTSLTCDEQGEGVYGVVLFFRRGLWASFGFVVACSSVPAAAAAAWYA